MTEILESTFTSTKGGSVGESAGAVLPVISPELLWFECFTTGCPVRSVCLPDGRVSFAHRGAVHAMPEDDWRMFEAVQRAA